jgi:hypothetical protein
MPSNSPSDDRRPVDEQSADRNGRSADSDDRSTEDDGSDTDTDDLLDALGHRHRRGVLSVLAGADSEHTVGTLAREVAERLPDRSNDRRRSERSLAVRLYHVHLPKLSDAGLVEFDAATRRVSAAGTASPSKDPAETADAGPLWEFAGVLVDGTATRRFGGTAAEAGPRDPIHDG